MCVGGGMQNITCSVFSQEDLSLFYAFGALPSTCTPVMYPSGGTLKISINLPDFSETQDSWALTVSVQGVFLHAFESLKYTECTTARNKPNG